MDVVRHEATPEAVPFGFFDSRPKQTQVPAVILVVDKYPYAIHATREHVVDRAVVLLSGPARHTG